MKPEHVIVISAIVSALISAAVSAIGQWVTRKNAKLNADVSRENSKLAAKISQQNEILSTKVEVAKTLTQSRQAWIDNLRQDMADFLALSAKRHRQIRFDEDFEAIDMQKLLMLGARIRLRMNPHDESYNELLKHMRSCSLEKESRKHGEASNNFTEIGQRILKNEWKVLKADLQKLNLENDSYD